LAAKNAKYAIENIYHEAHEGHEVRKNIYFANLVPFLVYKSSLLYTYAASFAAFERNWFFFNAW
jgi:hypothetical protein